MDAAPHPRVGKRGDAVRRNSLVAEAHDAEHEFLTGWRVCPRVPERLDLAFEIIAQNRRAEGVSDHPPAHASSHRAALVARGAADGAIHSPSMRMIECGRVRTGVRRNQYRFSFTTPLPPLVRELHVSAERRHVGRFQRWAQCSARRESTPRQSDCRATSFGRDVEPATRLTTSVLRSGIQASCTTGPVGSATRSVRVESPLLDAEVAGSYFGRRSTWNRPPER